MHDQVGYQAQVETYTLSLNDSPKLPLTLHRIAKVTGPVTFRISSPEGQQLSGSSYFRVAVTLEFWEELSSCLITLSTFQIK